MAKGAKSRDKTDRDPVLVDFALQGGGSHGRVHLGRARPISRGALAQGRSDIGHVRRRDERGSALHPTANEGGTEGARVALDAYWGRVAKAARFSPLQRSPLDRMMNRWTLDTSPGYLAMDLMSRVFSPYEMRIRRAVIRSARFWQRASISPTIKLFITATNVHTGRGRIFRNPEITPDVLLASRLPADHVSRRLRSTASLTGTAVTPATRPSRRSCAKATRTTPFSTTACLTTALWSRCFPCAGRRTRKATKTFSWWPFSAQSSRSSSSSCLGRIVGSF